MKTEQLIKQLKESGLYAECTCGEEFRLCDAILFDGTKPMPKEALEAQNNLMQRLKDREEELSKQKKLATDRAQNTAKSVGVGKNIEKIFPTLKDFKWELPDARFLSDPIDLITFNGMSKGNIMSINFIEVKSGNARLNKHQKSVKEAVEDKKVVYKEFK